ncbi:DUF551 domain-containing protein [Escherichia coli]|uniref:DUF551 domain-containing protein n=4 Tax=Enterobacteriaceae TaxID=543 RepID=A0A377FDQ8_ECOLX|nr:MULTISPECIES: DUF551 domain-containing protein [Shigella]EEZ5521549.1 DUF551 domain-containing protein [Escherichia coli]EFX9989310.1 DUF551 domain-containing protein [Shigella flexneri]EHD3375589.1 DUF551 domain-containing protein [Escherichia coli O124]EHD3401817.1 DUF551 domain-containing protein [Escherichia coli O152]EHD3421714.1 DUF551 domain-containing protein [Escherichia coli O167]EIQ46164.1 hypothetical protein SS322685_1283 [Shigella sonnei 3226-85]EIQ46832.1 hypothetical prote
MNDKELIKEIKERISSLDVRDNVERRAYEIALASLTAEPVAWKVTFTQIDREYNTFTGMYSDKAEVERWVRLHKACNFRADITPLYTAQPVPVTPDAWISCSERMPEMGERQCYVLAADFKNNYPPNIPNTQVGVYGDWFNDGNPTWDDGDGEDLYLKEVTHWMQLPEPPQEVNRG